MTTPKKAPNRKESTNIPANTYKYVAGSKVGEGGWVDLNKNPTNRESEDFSEGLTLGLNESKDSFPAKIGSVIKEGRDHFEKTKVSKPTVRAKSPSARDSGFGKSAENSTPDIKTSIDP